jgi:hypothetical protein
MYIPSKVKCQLSFNWHLNLIEVYATQSWCVPVHKIYNVQKWVIDTINHSWCIVIDTINHTRCILFSFLILLISMNMKSACRCNSNKYVSV